MSSTTSTSTSEHLGLRALGLGCRLCRRTEAVKFPGRTIGCPAGEFWESSLAAGDCWSGKGLELSRFQKAKVVL